MVIRRGGQGKHSWTLEGSCVVWIPHWKFHLGFRISLHRCGSQEENGERGLKDVTVKHQKWSQTPIRVLYHAILICSLFHSPSVSLDSLHYSTSAIMSSAYKDRFFFSFSIIYISIYFSQLTSMLEFLVLYWKSLIPSPRGMIFTAMYDVSWML